MSTLSINLDPIIKLTDDQFYQLCQGNPNVKLERNALGELLIMPRLSCFQVKKYYLG
jgi:Uma2 family endonuclease